MQKGSSVIIVIAIVAVLAALAGWWYWSGHMPASQTAATTPAGATSTSPSHEAATPPSGSVSADTSVTQDLSAVDAQMGAFASDSSSVSGSLSDQPIQQSSL